MNFRLFSAKAMIISAALALVMSGCSNSSPAANGSTGDSKKITLKYWSMWNKDEPQQKVLQKIIEEFEKSNPNIKVDVQWAGRQVLPKVQQTIISGGVPDLIDKDEQEIAASLVNSNQAESLDDILDNKIDGENVTINDVVKKEHIHFYDKNGHTYILPYEVITSGVWYNKALFDKYGIQPPKTWSEFKQVAAKLKGQGIAPVAADGTVDFYNAYWFYWLSNRTLGPGAFHKAAQDKTGEVWRDPGFLQVAKEIHELAANYMAGGYQGSKYPAGQVSWAQGKAGMLLMGSWAPSETAGYAGQGFEYQMFPFPVVDLSKSKETDMETYLVGWSIPKGATNVEAAKKFILFAMNKNRLQGISTVAQNLTSRTDIEAPKALKVAQELFAKATDAHPVYDGVQTDFPDYWQKVFLPLDNKLFFNQISPEEFISELTKQSKQYWASH